MKMFLGPGNRDHRQWFLSEAKHNKDAKTDETDNEQIAIWKT